MVEKAESDFTNESEENDEIQGSIILKQAEAMARKAVGVCQLSTFDEYKQRLEEATDPEVLKDNRKSHDELVKLCSDLKEGAANLKKEGHAILNEAQNITAQAQQQTVVTE